MASERGVFRLGLIGAGRMGQTHLRALIDSEDVAIVAVAEPIDALRAHVTETFGVRGFATLNDMLDQGGIDGALIVTPSDSHVAVIDTVARAKLPILCEKPCGLSSSDTRTARQLVQGAGVALQIAYWRRFVPELQVIRERIVDGDFGEILSISCLQWDGEPPPVAFRHRSGGIFVDMGVHEFDQARWLTGSDLAQLRAVASSVVTDPDSAGDPDSAQALGMSESGASVFVTLGRHYVGGDMASVEVFGTRDHVLSVFLDPSDGERAQLAALRRQASAFAEYARGGTCRGSTIDDAIAALEAAEQLRAQI
ncbi:MAG TPA: Gfo/Idh/MocA family oxidoreductase [Acidimicrobiales bacterium]|nr:Gfo/Idh/MocA family oxidoreductase [Acidimicrobiales bacterium]